jgi:hypothetical protein
MTDYIPTNFDYVIDSRDVIEAIRVMDNGGIDDCADDLADLKELNRQGEEASPDWSYGATLIRDTYFTAYAEELANDCGLIRDNAGWPYQHIDWEMAARDLQIDYTPVGFAGVTYWVR